MAAADSIPRRVIDYLLATLPDEVQTGLQFDAVAQSGDKYPVCVVTACPSIPATRHGGKVIRDHRSANVFLGLVWDADDGDGRNYDDFEEAMTTMVDAMCEMQGTAALGTRVLMSEVDKDDSMVEMDVQMKKYYASIKCVITFNR